MATKHTPQMYARGSYELKNPWVASANKVFTCIASRSFEDIYKQGEDVYKTYYQNYILDGSTVNGQVFNFDEEAQSLPNICTLRSEENEIIYVPDTYILSFPNTTLVPYSNVVLGLSLGPLPDEMDLISINAVLVDNIKKYFGITAEVTTMRIPTSTNPTPEEHEQWEESRKGAITSAVSVEEQLEMAKSTIDDQRAYIQQLELSLQST